MEDSKQNSVKSPSVVKTTSTKGLDFIIVGAISLIFFLCPIFFTGLAAQGLGFEKMILFYFLVLIGLVAWVTKGVIQGELNLKRTPLDWPIIATIVIFAVSAFFSVSAKDSIIGSYGSATKGLAAVVIFALFYYLVVNNINIKRIKTIFWALAFSSFLVIIYSLLQLNGFYILPFKIAKAKTFNPIGSLSALTMFVVAVLPLLVITVTQAKDFISKGKSYLVIPAKIIFGIALLAGLIILALLNGFTFWPVAIVGMVIVLMFFLAKIIKISTNNLLVPLGVFLALIILLVLGNFNIMNMNLPAEVSLSRAASWDITKASLKANPILGSGPSTFYYAFSKYKSINFNASPLWNVRFDSATGIIFGLLATVGILGAIAIVIQILITLSVSFLTLIKTKEKEINPILLGLFASFISLILFAFLFSGNNTMILFTVLIAVFAVAAALVMYPEKYKTIKLSFRASAKYALALAAIFLCVSAGVVVLFTIGLKMYIADVYAKQALNMPDLPAKIEKLNRAVALAPYQDGYYLNLANGYMIMANRSALRGQDQADVGTNLSLAIESGKKAVEIASNKAANNESLGLIYENASFYTRGALEWSEQLYNKVIKLDPQNPVPYMRLALVNMARSNAETDRTEQEFYISEAIKKYDEAIAKKGDLAAAYYGKAIASEKLGDTDNAIEELKRANLVARDNLDYRFELGRLFFNRGVVQPNLTQTATAQIAEEELTPEGEEGITTPEAISVEPTQPTGAVVAKNNDLAAAEQLFLSILMANSNHANARYSLAVLYQKTGEIENARIMASSLLDIISDEQTIKSVRQQFADIL